MSIETEELMFFLWFTKYSFQGKRFFYRTRTFFLFF